MNRMMHIIAAGAALFSASVFAEGEDLITNGSFETYKDTSGAFPSSKHVNMDSRRSVTPWTYAVQGNGLVTIAYSGDGPFLNGENAPDGNVVMAFQRNASLSQRISVPASGVCKVSFKYRSRSGYVGGKVSVQIDGKITVPLPQVRRISSIRRTSGRAWRKDRMCSRSPTAHLQPRQSSTSFQ